MKIEQATKITHDQLIKYLERHGIPLEIANRYLKQVRIHNKETGEKTFALAQRNDDDGYHIINNPFDNSFDRDEAPTFIRGKNNKKERIHIFKNCLDYLSIIYWNKGEHLEDDTVILNSLLRIELVPAYIKDCGYHLAYTWMDNNELGQQATISLDNFFKDEGRLLHTRLNRLYAQYTDVNAWHMAKLGLTK